MTNKSASLLLWRVLVWSVLALAFALSVHRAKTLTIAHDEALEYEWFLDDGVAHVLTYNPANHILFTLLAKPVVWSLGVSEFHLRMPSLLGTAIYLLAGYLLCRKLFGEGLWLSLSVSLLALNPEVQGPAKDAVLCLVFPASWGRDGFLYPVAIPHSNPPVAVLRGPVEGA
jgi:predicted membrane-bound mannosyltransferase